MKELFRTLGLAVNGIRYPDMTIYENKITFLTGPSGCGKSTLFRIFNGTLDPEEGTLFYRGQDIRGLDSLTHRREVSLVSQSVFLFPGTIRENFRQFYQFRELPEPDPDRIRFFLELCCLTADPDTDCTTFSGGEKQRVYLAIFLSFEPRVVLLDEPTSALDTITSRSGVSASPRAQHSTSRELTWLCSRNWLYCSTLSWSMPPPAWRLRW